ncbi:glycosyltransferase family 2 protein [Aeromonas sp. QDB21]|uniref:glycosyltransferase family 2 protein n=1 Tax=Aeromonas sp. QDB21 TaxID=2990487 RepID=UPI0022E35848|nr:glycosyltransferase family 2 protein [Aeromonas sp. QDB21]
MKFTLAIISYNAESVIKNCLDSCIKQSYKDLDILVVDDNSSDNTIDIVNEYQKKDKRINLIQHQTNKSALQARKTVFKHAKSQYIWFIDSDDSIVEGSVGEIFRALKANHYPDMLTFGSNDYYENGQLKRVFYDWGVSKSLIEWKRDSDYRPYTRVIKKSVIQQVVNLIPDDLYLYRHNDFFMFNLVKLFTQTKAHLQRPLYNYTLSANSVTNQKDKQSISRHIELLDTLLTEYQKVATAANQTEVNIAEFVTKERNKLTKYALNQYKGDPKTYLHTLKTLYNNETNIIISLTTYSKRIQTVHITIESLLRQSLLADKIILWLDETEVCYRELPQELTALESEIFEIHFCPNYKSYKKLIPTLKLYPDATVITFDDDIDYPADQVEKLVVGHFENPHDIITHVARNILLKDGKLLPYTEWKHAFKEQVGKPYRHLLPVGVGGVLYPQGSLNPEVMNIDAFMNLAPHGDDLWFKCMTLLNERQVIALGHGFNLSPNMIDGTQDVGLWQSVNEDSDSNFVQLNNIIQYYSKLKEKMMLDTFEQTVLSNVELCAMLHNINNLRVSEGKLKHEIKALNTKIENIDITTNTKALHSTPSIKKHQFDEEWYLNAYPDVAKSGLRPREHFEKIGRLINRKPHGDLR